VADGLNFRIIDHLRSLQQKLGRAREWDVLVKETLKHAPQRLLKKPFSAQLEHIVEGKRGEGHKQARDALRDRHCTDLLLRLAYWIDVESGISSKGHSPQARPNSDALTAPGIEFAAKVIRDYHRKTRRLGKRIRDLDSTQLHRLRIRIKKLRYATEFFCGLWPPRRTKKYLSALKDLQEGLGTYHDTIVAGSLMASLEALGESDIKSALEVLSDWLASEQQRKRKEVIALWSLFSERKLFWKQNAAKAHQ
jgi:CHAD domain-containing protein